MEKQETEPKSKTILFNRERMATLSNLTLTSTVTEYSGEQGNFFMFLLEIVNRRTYLKLVAHGVHVEQGIVGDPVTVAVDVHVAGDAGESLVPHGSDDGRPVRLVAAHR